MRKGKDDPERVINRSVPRKGCLISLSQEFFNSWFIHIVFTPIFVAFNFSLIFCKSCKY